MFEDKQYNFTHKCCTRSGSSGSPILNLKNKIIGLHKEGHSNKYNIGLFLNYSIKEFIKQNDIKNNIYKKDDNFDKINLARDRYKDEFENSESKDIKSNNTEKDDSDSEILIDQEDLIIITDKKNWNPSKEIIQAYAEKLAIDINIDSPELLTTAEKYLKEKIPDDCVRAFMKKDLKLVYINTLTNDIVFDSVLEEKAKEELQKMREKINNKKNKEKKFQNKKIPPIGFNKKLKDIEMAKEKEFFKIAKVFENTKRKLNLKKIDLENGAKAGMPARYDENKI